jgi:hypothetical protein
LLFKVNNDNWPADSPKYTLKKEANWLEFIQLIPQKDHVYEKTMAKIKLKLTVDQYLLPHNSFIEISNDDRVEEAFKENALIIKNTPNIEATSVTTHTTSFNTTSLWKKVLNNPNLKSEKKNENSLETLVDPDASSKNHKRTVSFRGTNKVDEFNYTENLQKLGLEDNKTSEQNASNVQGSYLSFLLLRHLQIRDLKRKALSILNYFRSIERTITIYDGGLSLEANHYKRYSKQDHMKETNFGQNIGYHAYLFNTPKDYKLSEAEFMEFQEIENHDDYHTIDEKGIVHVQDQRGFYIMYDVALNDLKKLENDLILIASYYIAKDKETVINKSKDQKKNLQFLNEQEIDLGAYSHQNIDRFAVILDIWTNEVNFLESKMNLFNIYYESYQNVFDKNERRQLAQAMTDLMHKNVRFDLNENYFVE